MDKTEIESILIANWYFTTCKLSVSNPQKCEKTELARKYLLNKIKKALTENRLKTKSVKAFSFISLLSSIRLIF